MGWNCHTAPRMYLAAPSVAKENGLAEAGRMTSVRERTRRWMPHAMRLLYPALLALAQGACVFGGPRAPRRPTPADSLFAMEAWKGVQNQYWKGVLPRRPDIALAIGRRIEDLPSPVHAVEDNGAGILARRIGDELEGINANALSPVDYASFQTLRWEVEAAAEAAVYGVLDFSLLSPRRTSLRDALLVVTGHPFASAPDLDRYLYLLDNISFWMIDARNALELRARDRSYATVDAVRTFRTFLDSLRVLLASPGLRVASERLTMIDSTLLAQFRQQEEEELTQRVRPGLDSLIAYLDRYVGQAMPRPGLWQYPGGKEYYRFLLRRSLGVEIEPEEAHRVGVAEVRRIDSMLVSVRRRMGWTGTAAALNDSLRRSAAFAPIGIDSVMARTRALMTVVRDSLVSRIDKLPTRLPIVRAATPMEQLLHPAGFIRPPEYVDSVAQVVVTPVWGSRAVQLEGKSHALRWTWPGMAMAATVAYEQDPLSPIPLLHPSESRVLGWGEYAASLAGEIGLYTDPLEMYGRLMHEGWNAALLVADTGLHYYGWTPAQALAVMRPFSFADDSTLDEEFVTQIVQSPGSGGAATVGAREHAAMRAWMQRTLDSSFRQSTWHQAVLAMGPVPLPVLASYLEWWAWNEGQKARAAAAAAQKR